MAAPFCSSARPASGKRWTRVGHALAQWHIVSGKTGFCINGGEAPQNATGVGFPAAHGGAIRWWMGCDSVSRLLPGLLFVLGRWRRPDIWNRFRTPRARSAPRRERAIRPGLTPLEARLRRRCNVWTPDLSPHGWAPADIPARTAISPNKRFLLQLQFTTRVVGRRADHVRKRLRTLGNFLFDFRERKAMDGWLKPQCRIVFARTDSA